MGDHAMQAGRDDASSATKKVASAAKTGKGDSTTTITERDIKLLWGRAASRCAFPDCPLELTMDSTTGDPSAIGEMAHVVGEKEGAARGVSKLPLSQRNTYSNLILLCPTHHTVIDKKENVVDYPVEVLHEMKEAHESRVRELFAAKPPADPVDPADILYADLVDRCTNALMLERWEWFADGAVRQILPEQIDEAQPVMAEMAIGTVWPQRHLSLDEAIKRVAADFVEFADHFRSKSILVGPFYRPDRAYKNWPIANQHAEEVVMERWHQLSFLLLQRYVCRLNAFASEVRRFLNPMYFLLRGEFLLHDGLGIWHDLQNVIWKPDLGTVETALAELNHQRGA